jgi:hypothetical protein
MPFGSTAIWFIIVPPNYGGPLDTLQKWRELSIYYIKKLNASRVYILYGFITGITSSSLLEYFNIKKISMCI